MPEPDDPIDAPADAGEDSAPVSGRPPPDRRASRRKNPLGPDSEIGARLRELFEQTELEPVPADLIDLLQRLDEAENRDGAT